jgi:hypothetical protein
LENWKYEVDIIFKFLEDPGNTCQHFFGIEISMPGFRPYGYVYNIYIYVFDK